ncbi:endonuclease/exonuclease/phosphatase family protein [Variovorax sp. J22R133]|uniref:endonuclease/exonuclease/phosphatase family protein n=1 Tax=Variovorax brevis TaxID=3053503 RepID=UPI002575AFBB|nr:endonuclease/exonuclease/phosphatase family protein [Variovorax sp. J22R133]MDM0114160.1 endonuclease/exonuclease/phosphatase family protein [Variovorax sp. J22R133]
MSNMYAGLRRDIEDETDRTRCADRLLAMRSRLAPLKARKTDSNLLLATWNIRDFDSNKFKFGPRLPETFYYLAEIISCFDLVALQEVNRDLAPLDHVMRILGREWDYIVTDTTEGPGGNQERMAFVYNKEKVWFRKIAGEVVLPDGQLIVSPKKVKVDGESIDTEAKQQFARSPFLVAFQSGWFRFSLCTVHIYYGSESGAQLQRRIEEIKRLVKFFADRQDDVNKQELDRRGAVENYLLLGDFNVVSPEHETMKALKSQGFEVPGAIDGAKVRKKGMHFYDQIAVRVKDQRFNVTAGGIVDMFEDVFRVEDLETYKSRMPDRDPEQGKFAAKTPESLYAKWRTWQMSDHSPLWIEVGTDFADTYLKELAKKG